VLDGEEKKANKYVYSSRILSAQSSWYVGTYINMAYLIVVPHAYIYTIHLREEEGNVK
jgi:hypothetical protein